MHCQTTGGCSGLALAAQSFAREVDGFMVGHDDVRLLANTQLITAGEMALSFQRLNFFDQDLRIDDDAIANNAQFVCM